MRKMVAMKNIWRMAVYGAFVAAGAFADDLERAREALRDGMWRIAVEHADAAYRDAGDAVLREAAQLAAIEALARDGRFKEALARIEDAERMSLDAAGDAMRYWHAWVLWRLGRTAEALGRVQVPLKDLVWQDKGDVLAARLMAGEGRDGEALARLERVLAKDNAEACEARLVAAGIEAAKDANGYSGIYGELYAKGDGAPDGVFAAAAMKVSEEEWRKGGTNAAIRAARAAAARADTPEGKRAAQLLAACEELETEAKREEAAAEIRRIVEDFPDAAECHNAQLRLADSLLRHGDAAGAQAEYEHALELHPAHDGDARALEGLGRALAAQGKNAKAAGCFAQAAGYAANAEEKARALFAQADMMFKDALWTEAAEKYLECGDFEPERCAYAAGLAYEKAGNEAKAEELWKKAAAGEGAWAAESLLELARLDERRNRVESAAALAGKVLERADGNRALAARARIVRGKANYKAYRFQDAARDFETAAEEDGADADAMKFLCALCRFGEGREDEARHEAEKVAARTKDEDLKRNVVRWLARLDYNAGDWAGAEKRFAECGETLWAARAAAAGNEFPRAVERAAKVIGEAKDKDERLQAAILQGEALIELARYDEAALVLDRAAQTTDAPDMERRIAVLKADALFAMGADDSARWQEALEAYRDALKLGAPGEAERLEISFKAAKSLEKLRRGDEAAKEYYENVVLAYADARAKGTWFDKDAYGIFARAAFRLADYYENRGEDFQAAQILKIVLSSSQGKADDARKRLENIRRKGRIL